MRQIQKFLDKFYIITKVISSIIIIALLIYFLIHSANNITRLFLLPFLLAAICLFGSLIAVLINNYKIKKIFDKSYIIVFLIYWFGVLLIGSVSAIKQASYGILLFTIPFWLAGILLVYKSFIKKK